jgi:hypothetical protein
MSSYKKEKQGKGVWREIRESKFLINCYYCAAGILIFLNVCSGGMWSKSAIVKPSKKKRKSSK